MSGIKYLFDTNALISFFQGNPALSHFASQPLGISIITVLEFLSLPEIDETDTKLLFAFLNEIQVLELKKDNLQLIETISKLRINSRIKLPDAIIAGTAIENNAVLIINDKGFSRISFLQTTSF